MQQVLTDNQNFLYERIKQWIETGKMDNPFTIEIKENLICFQFKNSPPDVQLPSPKYEDDFNALVEFLYILKNPDGTYTCTSNKLSI